MPWLRASIGVLNSTSLPVEVDLACGRLLDAGDLAHEGGFARAVVADDGDMLAVAQLEIGLLQRVDAAIALGQPFGLQDDLLLDRHCNSSLGSFALPGGRTPPSDACLAAHALPRSLCL